MAVEQSLGSVGEAAVSNAAVSNAAVGEAAVGDTAVHEIRDEQRELGRLLRDIRHLFHARHADHPSVALRLLDELDELREHLGMIFALKETGGYLDEVVAEVPSLCGCADRLRSEHVLLFNQLSQLIDQCDEDVQRHRWPECWKMAQLTFHNFCQRLRAHHAGEVDLLQKAMSQDIGVGD